MTLSPTFWNSVCLTHSFNTNSAMLTINGHMVLNATAKYSNESNYKNLSNSKITLELGSSEGEFSDFNFWSRPLFMEDLEEYFEALMIKGSVSKT